MPDEQHPLTPEPAAELLARQNQGKKDIKLTENQHETLLQHSRAMEEVALKASVDYGKWTIGTILAYCAAIAVAIRPALRDAFVSVFIVSAFVFISAAGAAAWHNWDRNSKFWSSRIKALLEHIEYSYSPPEPSKWISWTYWAAIILSILAFVLATIALALAARSGYLTPDNAAGAALISNP